MLAFRNHSSPTVSQLLRFSRSPVTITILGSAPGAAGTRAQPDATNLAIDVLYDVIARLERADTRVLPDSGQVRRIPYGSPGIGAHAGAFAHGVVAALLAASVLSAPRHAAPTLPPG